MGTASTAGNGALRFSLLPTSQSGAKQPANQISLASALASRTGLDDALHLVAGSATRKPKTRLSGLLVFAALISFVICATRSRG
jgi:hypothetical protein